MFLSSAFQSSFPCQGLSSSFPFPLRVPIQGLAGDANLLFCVGYARSISTFCSDLPLLWNSLSIAPERARWRYLAIRDYPLCPARKSRCSFTILLILYWPSLFACYWLNIPCVLLDLVYVSVHKHRHNLRHLARRYPAILTEQAWSIIHIHNDINEAPWLPRLVI